MTKPSYKEQMESLGISFTLGKPCEKNELVLELFDHLVARGLHEKDAAQCVAQIYHGQTLP